MTLFMFKPTIKEIKEISTKDRHYPYDTWLDKIFSPPAPYFAWFFITLGFSGNAVSWLGGFIAMAGGFCLASNSEPLLILGSFAGIIFYQLDYVDGSVSRFNKKASIGGQYIDLIMHSMSNIGIIAGISFGAVSYAGSMVVPFAIMTIVAITLTVNKSAFAWFAIVMEQQKRKSKKVPVLSQEPKWHEYKDPPLVYEITRKFTALIFFEGHLLFLLPILAFSQVFLFPNMIDFRLILVLIGAFIFLPISILEIVRLTNRNAIDEGYWKTFNAKLLPTIPEDHFFRGREKKGNG